MIDRAAQRVVTDHVGAQGAVWECQWCGKDFPEWLRTPGRRYCSGKCADAAYNRAHPVVRQRALPLTPPPAPVPPVRDQRPSVADRERLVSHNLRILDRLRCGPATNAELAALLGPASAWRTRVSDCRLWLERREGLTIRAERVKGGRWNYRLEAIR